MSENDNKQNIPILPLRDIVVFPHMIVPLFVGREKSVLALETVMAENKQILLLTQTDASTEEPSSDDLYRVGTLGTILQLLKLPDGTVKVLVEGGRSEEHTLNSSHTVISYAVFCLKKKKKTQNVKNKKKKQTTQLSDEE